MTKCFVHAISNWPGLQSRRQLLTPRMRLPCMRGDLGTSTVIVAIKFIVEGARQEVYCRPHSPSWSPQLEIVNRNLQPPPRAVRAQVYWRGQGVWGGGKGCAQHDRDDREELLVQRVLRAAV